MMLLRHFAMKTPIMAGDSLPVGEIQVLTKLMCMPHINLVKVHLVTLTRSL